MTDEIIDGVAVRIAAPADASTLSELAAATFPLACPPHTTPEAIADFISRNFTVTHFEGYIADPHRALFLAEENGQAVGYAMLIMTEPTDENVASSIKHHPSCELSKLYVRPGYHGGGVSTALIDAAIEYARADRREGMWLGVNEENARANAFYEKSGFAKVGVKQFHVGGRLEDDFVRELKL
jgi:ribosomal protein S18 acetylase RimI-like enzyme